MRQMENADLLFPNLSLEFASALKWPAILTFLAGVYFESKYGSLLLGPIPNTPKCPHFEVFGAIFFPRLSRDPNFNEGLPRTLKVPVLL